MKATVGKEQEIILKFHESLVSHVEIANLKCASIDASIKLVSTKKDDKVVFENAQLYQYFKTPSRDY